MPLVRPTAVHGYVEPAFGGGGGGGERTHPSPPTSSARPMIGKRSASTSRTLAAVKSTLMDRYRGICRVAAFSVSKSS